MLLAGLRIAPKEAPVTGYIVIHIKLFSHKSTLVRSLYIFESMRLYSSLQFGKGVYFADVSTKSANYCYATRTRPLQHLVLSEVNANCFAFS